MPGALVSSRDRAGASGAGDELDLDLPVGYKPCLHKQNLTRCLSQLAQQASFAQTPRFGLRGDQSSNTAFLKGRCQGAGI